jgi:hypothetical protein
MYFIFRYAHYVLDIEIVALFVRRVVTYGVQSIIAFTVMYSHVRSEVVAKLVAGYYPRLAACPMEVLLSYPVFS